MSFLNLEVLKGKPKVHMNNDPCKAFKNMGHYSYGLCDPCICFWDKKIEKQTKIAIHMDL
jgi:hypothetical protein